MQIPARQDSPFCPVPVLCLLPLVGLCLSFPADRKQSSGRPFLCLSLTASVVRAAYEEWCQDNEQPPSEAFDHQFEPKLSGASLTSHFHVEQIQATNQITLIMLVY